MNLVGAFTTEHAARLSGLSKRRLEYWDRTGVLSPSLGREGTGRTFGRIYTFQDVVALRALSKLRARFPLQRLRELGNWLRQNYHHPWSQLRFYVAGDEIVYVDPETQQFIAARPLGQGALPVELEPIAHEVHDALELMRRRDPEDIGSITRHRYVLHNEWVAAGTRIPVWMIQDLWHSEYSIDDIMREYPELTRDDVVNALEFQLPPSARSAG